MILSASGIARDALVCGFASALGLLAGCGGGGHASPANQGTGVGVSLATAGNKTILNAGETLAITATVLNDQNAAGVTWTLTGNGTLSGSTTTAVTYNAPATISGALKVVIVATSVFDSTRNSSLPLLINGDPVMVTPAFFPANVGTAYSGALTVTGGKSPFTWSLASGSTLPAGLTLTTSTTSTTSISGTPTTKGDYAFDVQVADSASPARTATAHIALTVNDASACALNGHFAFLATGVVSGVEATRAGAVNVALGNFTGALDHREAGMAQVESSLTGTCSRRSTNNGDLTFTGASDSPKFSYAVNLPLTRGRLQLTSGANLATGSGYFERQDTAAFSLASLAGDYAFGLLGSESTGRPLGLAGHMSVASDGSVGGVIDGNGSSALSAMPLTGTLGVPDSGTGRGLLTLTAGAQSFALVYYVVNADRLLLVNGDTAATAASLAGTATRRSVSFDASSLSAPAVLSLWGSANTSTPTSVMSLARLSNANSGALTVDLTIDTFDRTADTLAKAFNASIYAVDAAGRVTLDIGAGASARHFVLHLDGGSNGYVIENGGSAGSAGLLEVQSGATSGSMTGFLLMGTEHPEGTAPLVLVTAAALDSGSLGSSAASGLFAVDSATGRGFGSLTVTGVGTAAAVLYRVNAGKTIIMRGGSANANATLNWLQN